jgi:hypothetical protein
MAQEKGGWIEEEAAGIKARDCWKNWKKGDLGQSLWGWRRSRQLL